VDGELFLVIDPQDLHQILTCAHGESGSLILAVFLNRFIEEVDRLLEAALVPQALP